MYQLLLFQVLLAGILATPITEDVVSSNCQPSSYKVQLTVPQETFSADGNSFSGQVDINFQCENAKDYIQLHSSHQYIKILTLKLNGADATYTVDEKTDILKINLPANLLTDNVLVITYNGVIADDMYGLYKSSYVDNDKKDTRYLVATYFEPTHARRVIPCWDDPQYKATFDISITYPSGYEVLGNMDDISKSQVNKDGMVTTKFNQTPKMPTYLLAFTISQLTCDSVNEPGSTSLKVCSREDLRSSRTIAAKVTTPVLNALENIVDVKFSGKMKKLDQIAIPDYAIGGMENWGLITYREPYLLFDEQESSKEFYQQVVTVIAHELSHTWFGDLVTIKGWSETYLKEGFATYWQYWITHQVYPELQLDKQFLFNIQSAMAADSQKASQALKSDCHTVPEIINKFGDITYKKGASILNMVKYFMGPEKFLLGLKRYIPGNLDAPVTSENLWTSLGEIPLDKKLPATFRDVMKNWIESSGFPLIHVKKDGKNIIITQEKFSQDSSSDSKTETKWYVPITYTLSSSKNKAAEPTLPKSWLTPDDKEKKIEIIEDWDWVLLNNQVSAFYRVNYDDTLWEALKLALHQKDFSGIGDLNRAQVINDLFELAKAGYVKYSKVMDIITFLENDTSLYTWTSAFNGFGELLAKVGRQSELGKKFSEIILKSMELLYASVPISTPKTDFIDVKRQVLAARWACSLGKEDCLKEVDTAFTKFKKDPTKRPNKELRHLIYCNALRRSQNKGDWELLWNQYLSPEFILGQTDILDALGCISDKDLLKNYLMKTIQDKSGLKTQHIRQVFRVVARQDVDVALDFLAEQKEKFMKVYKLQNAVIDLVEGVSSHITTSDQLKKISDFVESANLDEDSKKLAIQAYEEANRNIDWLKKYENELREYFGLSTNTGSVTKVSSCIVVMLVTTLIYLNL